MGVVPYSRLGAYYFFCLQDGGLFGLFEVGANSRLGAYSNKYGGRERPIDFPR